MSGPMSGPLERLPRLLALVPYLQAHPGISATAAAADFAVSEDQLRRDLQLLWMCGLPGHGPGDLIDLSFEGDAVSVIFDAGMSRPLRLTAEEALALIIGLRTLAELPAVTDRDAVERALAKIEAVAGGPVDAADAVSVSLDLAERLTPVLQRAIGGSRAVRLRYYTATRDETTERVVDPLRVFELDGRSYLEAWCRRAEGMRVFRVDRIEEVDVLDEPANPPVQVQLRDLSEGVYTPAPEHLLVVLRVSASYAWVADYYPSEEVADTDGRRQISLRVADPAWVRILVLGSGGQVEVLAPHWLSDSIRADACAALAAYSIADGPSPAHSTVP
ncbi:MAG TPA: YafY family protein [Jatrophihabitantaceae bacterium]|jgi:proteasome accessory factor C|nr:YafY family protein [Jatrophihabitantaceae bacterium]